MQIADLNSAHFFLYSRIDYERVDSIPYRSRVFKLDRMRDLLARLGHPHHRVHIVHTSPAQKAKVRQRRCSHRSWMPRATEPDSLLHPIWNASKNVLWWRGGLVVKTNLLI